LDCIRIHLQTTKTTIKPINIGAADVDGDGVVTIGDVTSIIDYLPRGHW
jgi:hypothetical protein